MLLIVDLKILLGLNILKISYAKSIMFVKDMQIFIDGEEIRCENEKDPRKDLLKTLLIQSIKVTCFLFYKETD